MSNDTQVQAHMRLVVRYADGEAWLHEVEASARQLAEQRVIDKSELKRLVTQVFGDEFQIVRSTPSAPTAVDPDEREDFEAWATKKTFSIKRNDGALFYAQHRTQLLWQAWQARAQKGKA